MSTSLYETPPQRAAYCQAELGPAKAFRLERFGDLDIQFTGWVISHSAEPNVRHDRSTVGISLYYSDTGAYIACVTRHLPNRLGPEHPHIVKSKAAAFASPLELLAWLKEDGRGWLGDNSKIAWEEMCARLPWLMNHTTIRV